MKSEDARDLPAIGRTAERADSDARLPAAAAPKAAGPPDWALARMREMRTNREASDEGFLRREARRTKSLTCLGAAAAGIAAVVLGSGTVLVPAVYALFGGGLGRLIARREFSMPESVATFGGTLIGASLTAFFMRLHSFEGFYFLMAWLMFAVAGALLGLVNDQSLRETRSY